MGVRLADGRVFRGRTVVSNATRWDTFEKLMGGEERLPASERAFRQRYKKSPSFLSIHMGVRADALPPGQLCSLSSVTMPETTYRSLLMGSGAQQRRQLVHCHLPLPVQRENKIPQTTHRPLLRGQERNSVGSPFIIPLVSMQGPCCLAGRGTGNPPNTAVCSGHAL